MSDARRHLRAVPAITPAVTAQREIAVRFSSTSGLIVAVTRPLNSFRWVGPATLRFSEQGLLVVARRATLLGLRHAQRFIPAAQLRDVYREGNAVQVHLRGPRSPYFRLWAEDAASAAQIVALLPTRHTIEFESALQEPELAPAWRVRLVWLMALLATAACLAMLAWLAGYRAQAPRSPAPAALIAAAHPPTPRPPDLGADAAAADALLAEQDLSRVGGHIEALTTEFAVAFGALMDGRVSQPKFADELEQWLRPQWDDLEASVRRSNAAPGSQQERADDELMGTINNWQLALRAYTDDLRNQRQVVKPFEYLRRAEQHQLRAQQMESDLQRRRAVPPTPR